MPNRTSHCWQSLQVRLCGTSSSARDILASMAEASLPQYRPQRYPLEALPMGWAALALSSRVVAKRTKGAEALQCDGVGPQAPPVATVCIIATQSHTSDVRGLACPSSTFLPLASCGRTRDTVNRTQ